MGYNVDITLVSHVKLDNTCAPHVPSRHEMVCIP